MTGGNQTYEEQLIDLEAELENYIASLGVMPHKNNPVEDILSVSPEDLKVMSASECEQNALILTQYAITLQVKYNKMHAILKWIDSTLDELIIPMVGDYKAYSYDERRDLAMNDNSACMTLNGKKKEINLRRDSMYGLISKVETMAKFYGEIAKSKKWNK